MLARRSNAVSCSVVVVVVDCRCCGLCRGIRKHRTHLAASDALLITGILFLAAWRFFASLSAWPAAWRSRAHSARRFRFRTGRLKCAELAPAGAYAHLSRLQCHFGANGGANSCSPLVRWQHRSFCLCRPLWQRPRMGLSRKSRFL